MINVKDLKNYLKQIKTLKKQVSSEDSKTGQIHKNSILLNVEKISNQWFEIIKPLLISANFTEEQLDSYNKKFIHLLKLSSSKGNKRGSFISDLDFVIKTFTDDLIIKMYTGGNSSSSLDSVYNSLLQTIQDKEQNKYLEEAINCAKKGYLRAGIVLGWCAAMDQIQKKIEQLGFTQFNVTSAKMASTQTGRFKKYNKVFSINSLDDLKEVFDNDILWIIEGIELVDLNQHTRLKSCFDMRNHCAHPGEAPITPYNVMSFFSDINEIIFKNYKFKII